MTQHPRQIDLRPDATHKLFIINNLDESTTFDCRRRDAPNCHITFRLANITDDKLLMNSSLLRSETNWLTMRQFVTFFR